MEAGGLPEYVEAAYALRAPIAAGSWGIVGDGIVAGNGALYADVLFEARWRRQGTSDGSSDKVLASVRHTFNRDINHPFSAVPFSTRVPGIAADAAPGDSLIFRITVLGGDTGAFFIPNGDGKQTGGSIPRLDLPQ